MRENKYKETYGISSVLAFIRAKETRLWYRSGLQKTPEIKKKTGK
jgi:hypothetical protein